MLDQTTPSDAQATFGPASPSPNAAHEASREPQQPGHGRPGSGHTPDLHSYQHVLHDLTRLAATPLSLEARLRQAVPLCLRLLPGARALRLSLAPPGQPHALHLAAQAGEEGALDLGTAVDRTVLEERRMLLMGEHLVLPLTQPQGLHGVLVVRGEQASALPALLPGATAVAAALSLLLERACIEDFFARTTSTLTAVHPQPWPSDAPTEGRGSAEEDLLAALVPVLRRAVQTLASLHPEAETLVLLALPKAGMQRFSSEDLGGEISAEMAQRLAALVPHHGLALHPLADLTDEDARLLASPEARARGWHLTLVHAPLRTEGEALLAVAHPPAEYPALAEQATQAAAAQVRLGLEVLSASHALVQQGRVSDAFLSLAAHELRSPLTTVKGYAQLLILQARKHQMPESTVHAARSIEQQAARLAEMIDELHDAARIRRGTLESQPELLDLVAVAQQTVSRLAASHARHTLELTSDEPHLIGRWDSARVAQMVRALVDNALRFSPKGGRVEVHLARQGTMAYLTVRDFGIGVPESDRAHIFDYLYRAPSTEKRNLSGVGLGLFVAETAAREHGGKLWLEHTDTEGGGSQFGLLLPLQPAAESTGAPPDTR